MSLNVICVCFHFAGSFYLCRTQQNVFQNTKHFKIQWLDKDEKSDVYKFDFLDHTEIECVLTNVRMERVARETYELPEAEKSRIELILSKALKKEKGEPYEDLVVDTEEEISNEEGKCERGDCGLLLICTCMMVVMCVRSRCVRIESLLIRLKTLHLSLCLAVCLLSSFVYDS